MASSKLMDEINEQFLLCKICFEILKKPKTLNCMHTFCSDCIEKHMNAEQERSSYRYSIYSRNVSCPICRKKTEIPTGGIRRLPDNFLLSSLTDIILSRSGGEKGPPCEICPPSEISNQDDVLAVSKCLDCSKLLCKKCVDSHQKTKVTHNHDLYDVEVEKDIQCKEHEGESVRFYCEPCQMCVCVVCTFQAHKDHEVSSFNECITKHKNNLEYLVLQCKEKLGDIKAQIDTMATCEHYIKDTEEQIHDLSTAFTAVIRSREQQLIDEINELYGEDAMNFLDKKNDLQDLLENIQSTCNLTEIMIKDKSIEMMLLQKEIQGKLKNLLQCEIKDLPENLNKRVRFVHGSLNFGDLAVCTDLEQERTGDEKWDIYEHIKQMQFTKSVQTELANTIDSTTSMGCDVKGCMLDKTMQTRHNKMIEKETNTSVTKCENKSNMTDPPSVRNIAILTDEKKTGTAVTQTDKIRKSDVHIQVKPQIFLYDKQTLTPSSISIDRHTMTEAKETKEKHTFTITSTLETGTDPDNELSKLVHKPDTSEKETTTENSNCNVGTCTDHIVATSVAVEAKTDIVTTGTSMSSRVEVHNQDSMTNIKETSNAGTCTKVTITNSQGTEMPPLEQCDVAMETDKKYYKEFGIMTTPKIEHKSTEIEFPSVTDAHTMTFKSETKDLGTITTKTELINQETSMPKITTTNQAVETINSGLFTSDSGTNTALLQTVDKAVITQIEQIDKVTNTTFIQLVTSSMQSEILDTSEIGIGDMLVDTTDQSTETTKTELMDHYTETAMETMDKFTWMPQTHYKTVAIGTANVLVADTGNDPIEIEMKHENVGTSVELQEIGTSMPIVEFTEMCTGTPSVFLTDATTGMPVIEITETATGTPLFSVTDRYTEMAIIENLDQSTETDCAVTSNAHTSTNRIEFSDKQTLVSPDAVCVGVSTEEIARSDTGTVVKPDVASVGTSTIAVEFTDSKSGSDIINTVDAAVGISNVTTSDKCSDTERTQTASISTGTVSISLVDGSTEMLPTLKADATTSTINNQEIKQSDKAVSTIPYGVQHRAAETVSVNVKETATSTFSPVLTDKETMTPGHLSSETLFAFEQKKAPECYNRATMTSQPSGVSVETSTNIIASVNVTTETEVTSQNIYDILPPRNVKEAMTSTKIDVDSKCINTEGEPTVDKPEKSNKCIQTVINFDQAICQTDSISHINGLRNMQDNETMTGNEEDGICENEHVNKSYYKVPVDVETNLLKTSLDSLRYHSSVPIIEKAITAKSLSDISSYDTRDIKHVFTFNKKSSTLPVHTREAGTSTSDMNKTDQSTSTPQFIHLIKKSDTFETVMKVDKDTSTSLEHLDTVLAHVEVGTETERIRLVDKAISTENLDKDDRFNVCINKLKHVTERLHTSPIQTSISPLNNMQPICDETLNSSVLNSQPSSAQDSENMSVVTKSSIAAVTDSTTSDIQQQSLEQLSKSPVYMISIPSITPASTISMVTTKPFMNDEKLVSLGGRPSSIATVSTCTVSQTSPLTSPVSMRQELLKKGDTKIDKQNILEPCDRQVRENYKFLTSAKPWRKVISKPESNQNNADDFKRNVDDTSIHFASQRVYIDTDVLDEMLPDIQPKENENTAEKLLNNNSKIIIENGKNKQYLMSASENEEANVNRTEDVKRGIKDVPQIHITSPKIDDMKLSQKLSSREKRARNRTMSLDKPTFDKLPTVNMEHFLFPPKAKEGTPPRNVDSGLNDDRQQLLILTPIESGTTTRPDATNPGSSVEMHVSPNSIQINVPEQVVSGKTEKPSLYEQEMKNCSKIDIEQDHNVTSGIKDEVTTLLMSQKLAKPSKVVFDIPPMPPKRGMDSHIKTFEFIQNKAIDDMVLTPKDKSSHSKIPFESSAVTEQQITVKTDQVLTSKTKDPDKDNDTMQMTSPSPPRRGMASHIRTLELREAKAIDEIFEGKTNTTAKPKITEAQRKISTPVAKRTDETSHGKTSPCMKHTIPDKQRKISPPGENQKKISLKQTSSVLKSGSNKSSPPKQDAGVEKQGTSPHSKSPSKESIKSEKSKQLHKTKEKPESSRKTGDTDVWAEFENTYKNMEEFGSKSPESATRETGSLQKQKHHVKSRPLYEDLDKLRHNAQYDDNEPYKRPKSPLTYEKERKARKQILDMSHLLASPDIRQGSTSPQDGMQLVHAVPIYPEFDRRGRELSPVSQRFRSKSADRIQSNTRMRTSINPQISHPKSPPHTTYGVQVQLQYNVGGTVSSPPDANKQERLNNKRRELFQRAASVEEQVEDVLHELDDIIMRSKTRRSLAESSTRSYTLSPTPVSPQFSPPIIHSPTATNQNSSPKIAEIRRLTSGNTSTYSRAKTPPATLSKPRVHFKGVSPPRYGAGEACIEPYWEQNVDSYQTIAAGDDSHSIYATPKTATWRKESPTNVQSPSTLMKELQGAFNKPLKGSGVYMSRAELKKLQMVQNMPPEIQRGSNDSLHTAGSQTSGEGGFSNWGDENCDVRNIQMPRKEAKPSGLQKIKRYFKF